MKQLFLKHGQVLIEEVPAPICPPGWILVANKYSLISSGTESSAIKQDSVSLLNKIKGQPELIKQGIQSLKDEGIFKTWEKIKYDKEKINTMGYSSCGIVIQTGEGIENYQAGDKLACGGFGWASHAEIVSVPEKLTVKLPANVDCKYGAFTTIGSIALHGVHQAKAALGEYAAVIGLGLLGLITIQILKAAGVQVIGLDIDEGRVALGRKLGLSLGLVIRQGEPVEKQIAVFTEQIGVDAAIICASTYSNRPIELAANITRRKGKVVAVGGVGLQIPRDIFYYKELSLHIPSSYGPGRYDSAYEERGIDYPIAYVRWSIKRNMAEFLRLVSEQHVNLEPLINRVFNLDKAPAAYDFTMNAAPRPIAVLLGYPDSLAKEQPAAIKLQPVRKSKNTINLALIGCGNMAAAIHLPSITSNPHYKLAAVVARTAVSAKKAGERYHAGYFATDYNQVLKDKNIDMVFVSTRNAQHAEQIIQAVKAGKAVLAEKPMAVNEDECALITEALHEHPVPFSICFNRRYSPLTDKAKELIKRRSAPLVINYRINAGFFPKYHWIHDLKEGGRIIGEVCHFVDYCNYLTGAKPKRIKAQSIPVNQKTVAAQDNISASISYEDGSLATIIYTSLGHPQLPKEYIEIFVANSVIIIEDFKNLQAYGFGDKTEIALKNQDKGFSRQLEEFYKLYQGEPSICVSFDEALTTTKATQKIVESIRS